MLVRKAQNLDGLGGRIDQPGVGHAEFAVERELARAIFARGVRRQDFAHPVENDVDVPVGNQRQALAAPAGKVRYQHMLAEVEFGLGEGDPAARPPRPRSKDPERSRPSPVSTRECRDLGSGCVCNSGSMISPVMCPGSAMTSS